jgi:hypothetical protein
VQIIGSDGPLRPHVIITDLVTLMANVSDFRRKAQPQDAFSTIATDAILITLLTMPIRLIPSNIVEDATAHIRVLNVLGVLSV